MDSYEGDRTIPFTLNKYVYCRDNPVIRVDPSGFTDTAPGQLATHGGIANLASNLGATIARSKVAAFRTLSWVQNNPGYSALILEFGVPAGLYAGAEVVAEAADQIANFSVRLNEEFSGNSKTFSPGPVVRGVEIEEGLLKPAIERAGGNFYGGSVKGIDGELAVGPGGVLIQGRSHDIARENLLPTIGREMEALSNVDEQDLFGKMSKEVGGGTYSRPAGNPATAKIYVLAVPESQASYVVSPQFIQGLRNFAQSTRTIPLVKVVRNWPGVRR
jgi:hypothetical protein